MLTGLIHKNITTCAQKKKNTLTDIKKLQNEYKWICSCKHTLLNEHLVEAQNWNNQA